jgi:hypothetical protein
MATLKYMTKKSALESVDGKYTGRFLSNGTVYLNEIARKICRDRPATDEPELTLAARAIAAVVKEEVGENLNYVTTGTLCAFAPAISGSVPAMDSPLGEDNAFYVNIVPLDAISTAIGAVSPARDRSDAAAVAVDNIEGQDDQGSRNHNQYTRVRGHRIQPLRKGRGESIRLLKPDGSLASEMTVKDEDGCSQRIVAQLATTVESGTYILQINTKGYATPDAEVETYTKTNMVSGAKRPQTFLRKKVAMTTINRTIKVQWRNPYATE